MKTEPIISSYLIKSRIISQSHFCNSEFNADYQINALSLMKSNPHVVKTSGFVTQGVFII